MPEAARHPSHEKLIAFSGGKLEETAAAAVAKHLKACSACRGAMDSLPSGSFQQKLRADGPGNDAIQPIQGLPPELADLPKYRMVRELGRGRMGVVYQAVHKVMERPIAIKVINPSVLKHADAFQRFRTEIKAAAKLDNPSIARAFDADQVGRLHVLVTEYVEGKTLDSLVRARGPLPIMHSCNYVRQTALGLQHAFEQGIVHGEVKPGNLMLTPRGRVKILDFGLAHLRAMAANGGKPAALDSFMRTAEYASPEQANNAHVADTRSDIYSLGCTFHYLLLGRPPFEDDSVAEVLRAHMKKDVPQLHLQRADVPPQLSAVVARMLAKDPAERYQTPGEVAEALAQFGKVPSRPAAGGPANESEDFESSSDYDVELSAEATHIDADTRKLDASVKTRAPLRIKKPAPALEAKIDQAPTDFSLLPWWKRPVLATLAAEACASLLLILGVFLFTGSKKYIPSLPTEPEPIAARIEHAVDQGLHALRMTQQADGTWKSDEIGATALVGLTLLECGYPINHAAIQGAATAVRAAAAKSHDTQSIALAMVFLDRLGQLADEGQINALAVRLREGQLPTGAWCPSCPSPSVAEGKPPVGDHWNTQFAILGLWIGRRHGQLVDKSLERADNHFRASVGPEGGWGYSDLDGETTPSMTCAGLMALAMAFGARDEIATPQDTKAKTRTRPQNPKSDPLIRNAFRYLGAEIAKNGLNLARISKDDSNLYCSLWALDCVAVAYDADKIGDIKWHDWAANILLAKQGGDGSWSYGKLSEFPDTCFALLVLKRANFVPDLTRALKAPAE